MRIEPMPATAEPFLMASPETTSLRLGERHVLRRQAHALREGAALLDQPVAEGGHLRFARGRQGGEGEVAHGAFQRAVEERSEEHTSELQSLMRISYAVSCLKKKTNNTHIIYTRTHSHNK